MVTPPPDPGFVPPSPSLAAASCALPPSRVPAQLPSLYGGAVEDDELENALEALDVELDDLAIPQAPAPARRGVLPPAQRSGPHVVTDDGLEIDFDEE